MSGISARPPCGKHLLEPGIWSGRLNTNSELRIYPLSKYERGRPDGLEAKTIQDIIGGAEVSNKVGFSSLEKLEHSILPYLSRRDREYMARKMTDNHHIPKNGPLMDKKKEFMRNILEGAEEDGHGGPRLEEVDARDLSGTKVLVGSECFGKVYRVEWLANSCALKQFENDEMHWIEEENILSKLRHPNIVTVLGYVQRTPSHPHHDILMKTVTQKLHENTV